MKLSTKARYATRAMVDLALNSDNKPLPLKKIAARQNISIKYLEQVMYPLNVAGLVYARKGKNGGYMLTKPPEKITLYDIVCIVEGVPSPVECVDNMDYCGRANDCSVRDVWISLKEVVTNRLKEISLDDLMCSQKLKNQELI